MYSNPGAWASLLGVDFVRNNKAPGIDYATMHVYVDQWLCVTEGSTVAGQLEFLQCAPVTHLARVGTATAPSCLQSSSMQPATLKLMDLSKMSSTWVT